MPAVPIVVTTLITMSTELAPLKVITNPALLPSVAVGLLTVTVGVAFVSLIVPTAVSLVLAVGKLLAVMATVKFSFGSSIASVLVGTFSVAVVCPAGMIIVWVVLV